MTDRGRATRGVFADGHPVHSFARFTGWFVRVHPMNFQYTSHESPESVGSGVWMSPCSAGCGGVWRGGGRWRQLQGGPGTGSWGVFCRDTNSDTLQPLGVHLCRVLYSRLQADFCLTFMIDVYIHYLGNVTSPVVFVHCV